MAQYKPFKARLVMGSPFELNTKDHTGQPQPDESKHNWFMAFAVPKGAEWDAIYAAMYAEAAGDARCTAALCNQGGFNWKIEDCDAPDDPSKLGTASRPAGHMLIKFTRYKAMGPVKIVDGNYAPIINTSAVKRGDYFFVAGSCKFNGAATVKTNAGMYQNIDGLMFAESGEEIISEGAFNAAAAFAGFHGGQVVNGGVSQSGAPAAPPRPAPMPPAAPAAPVAPSAPPPPAHDLLVPPAPPVEEKYTYNGATYTKAQLLGMPGWTEDLIATHCTRV